MGKNSQWKHKPAHYQNIGQKPKGHKDPAFNPESAYIIGSDKWIPPVSEFDVPESCSFWFKVKSYDKERLLKELIGEKAYYDIDKYPILRDIMVNHTESLQFDYESNESAALNVARAYIPQYHSSMVLADAKIDSDVMKQIISAVSSKVTSFLMNNPERRKFCSEVSPRLNGLRMDEHVLSSSSNKEYHGNFAYFFAECRKAGMNLGSDQRLTDLLSGISANCARFAITLIIQFIGRVLMADFSDGVAVFYARHLYDALVKDGKVTVSPMPSSQPLLEAPVHAPYFPHPSHSYTGRPQSSPSEYAFNPNISNSMPPLMSHNVAPPPHYPNDHYPSGMIPHIQHSPAMQGYGYENIHPHQQQPYQTFPQKHPSTNHPFAPNVPGHSSHNFYRQEVSQPEPPYVEIDQYQQSSSSQSHPPPQLSMKVERCNSAFTEDGKLKDDFRPAVVPKQEVKTEVPMLSDEAEEIQIVDCVVVNKPLLTDTTTSQSSLMEGHSVPRKRIKREKHGDPEARSSFSHHTAESMELGAEACNTRSRTSACCRKNAASAASVASHSSAVSTEEANYLKIINSDDSLDEKYKLHFRLLADYISSLRQRNATLQEHLASLKSRNH